MSLKISGSGTSTIVEHVGAVLPAATPVPSLRTAMEDFGTIASWVAAEHPNACALIDGEQVRIADCLETIRRFILTR